MSTKVQFKDPNFNNIDEYPPRATEDFDDEECSAKISQRSCRALIIGSMLSFIHVCGILVSTYLLIRRVCEPDMPEKPINHICTTALLCPLYKVFSGLAGISIQLSGSVVGLTVNLFLVLGTLNEAGWALLVWLVAYAIGICGCVFLFAVMLHLLVERQWNENDVHITTMLLTLIPLLMAVIYMIFWMIIVKLWKHYKNRENQIYICYD
ncbi:hypothetical protein TCAL_14616 [Tigriopus californicus]|uniref:Uncharacterized protein n=1 Tax=Tigriopus californicus TaxID=6832 RepID=A0A553PB77_TIGCA|nr:uncharacterized protein LOC131892723 [Tigriopus californicus]TRY74928.1 hypothetical protein TCAL_14616 [Tigriopus californicus]